MIDVINEGRYQPKKYSVFGFHTYDLGDTDITYNTETDDPRTAIKTWCAAAVENPGDASIMAEDRDAACELIDWAFDNKNKIKSFINAFDKFPYRLDYILDDIDKQHNNRCRYFSDRYPDSVHPFDLG